MTFGWFAWLPNFITISRLVLTPVVIDMMVLDHWRAAFVIFVVAALSDGLDGWLARTFNLRSELGAMLDAIADKALIVSIIATLVAVAQVPATLAIVVISRDVLIVGAVAVSSLLARPLEIKPLRVSKATTVAQLTLLASVLSQQAFQLDLGLWVDMLQAAVAALTIASASVYFWRWVEHMRQ